MRYASITERLADTGGAKWAVHERGRALAAEGVDVVELTIGEPDVAPDPGLLEACADSMRAGRTRYSHGRGEPALLDALAARYARRRPDVASRNILCFPGAQTALFATMQGLVERGDAVLTPDPHYATYEGVVRAAGADMRPVPLRPEADFRLRAEDLAAAVTPACKALLLNNPHNPTGAVLSADDVAEIGAFAAAHDLWIVCDEVYEELIFDDAPFASPFDNPDVAERVVAISSISKTFAAPGFRSGWAVGPAAFCDRVLPISEAMLFGNQPFIADATVWALQAAPPTAQAMRDAYRRRARSVLEALSGVDALRPFKPAAGMFMFVDVSATGLDGDAFAWRLLDHGVAVMPGASFGDAARGWIRIALTAPDATLAEGARRIAQCAASL